MTKLSDAIDSFKGTGWSRSTIKAMFGGMKRARIGAHELPKGHRAKRKRLQKIQKESRRRNRL